MMMLNKVKGFFGFFNLNRFEQDLISVLKSNLSQDWNNILESQLKRFNKTDRVIKPANELLFGHTSFYWVKFGKSRFDFPLKFPTKKEEDVLATVDVSCTDTENIISVKFVLVHGFLFSIEYNSPLKVFQPENGYSFENFKLCLSENAE